MRSADLRATAAAADLTGCCFLLMFSAGAVAVVDVVAVADVFC